MTLKLAIPGNLADEVTSWLENIGYERFSPFKSDIPRFGITTSNNVESVNSRIRPERKLPILEMLQSFERMIAKDCFDRLARAEKKWNAATDYLTKYVSYDVKKTLDSFSIQGQSKYTMEQYSASTYLVKKAGLNGNIGIFGKVSREYSITIDAVDNSKTTCTCQFPKQNLRPCPHILFVCKHKGFSIHPFFNNVWRKSTYLEAYRDPENPIPPVIATDIVGTLSLEPLKVTQQQGRPKKGRKPSYAKDYAQQKKRKSENSIITDDAERKERKITQCRNCKQFGHNKRSCPLPPIDGSM